MALIVDGMAMQRVAEAMKQSEKQVNEMQLD